MAGNRKNNIRTLVVTAIAIVTLNLLGSFYFRRFDLTGDKRYTLTPTSLKIIDNIKEPLYVDVFLEGQFPGEFKRLQTETRQLLEEFKAYNTDIIFQFVNPLENESERDSIMESFLNRGLTPISVTVDNKGKQSQEVVFPWAIATYKNKSVKVPLLKNMMGASTQDKVISSVQHLEYAFSNAFNTVATEKSKKIAILRGNNELHELQMADFLKQVREQYYIGPFTLDSVSNNPERTLEALKKYDLAVIAKPKEAFSESEKQVLDQYIINGGKTLWLVETVDIEMDSLYNDEGTNLAFPHDLNLNDMFFRYGIRINPTLVKDVVMATPISLATGNPGSATQYTQFPWFYSPFVYPSEKQKNPIVTNLDGLKFEFANSIDTLRNNIRKTVLLQSSPYSKAVGTPVEVSLKMVTERPEQSEFTNAGNIPLAVLLEGKFTSAYKNRVIPFADKAFKSDGKETKMIVISDGDLIRNQLDKNFQPLELGYDKWTNKLYGNKEFLMNCVNYLLDDNGLINIRSKEVDIPVLDKEKVAAGYTVSQLITIAVPLVILALFGLLFTFLRKRKYGRK
jgi:gliding-associated putative ABC transporter substrate-binding component GldG